MDYDDVKGSRGVMVNASSKHASEMYVDVPVICLEDDDDDNDVYLKIDKDYKIFMDHLIDDNSLGPLFDLNLSGLDPPLRYEVDNGEFETRKFDMFSGESKRSDLKNENPVNNRVSQQRERKTVEISRAASLVIKRESIQRDNRAAERRKRKIALIAREQGNIQRDTKMSGSKVEGLRDLPLVIAQESIQRDTKMSGSKVEGLRDVPLVIDQESIQRDNRAAERKKRRIALLTREQDNIHQDTKMSGSKVESLWDVPLVIAQEIIQRDNGVRKTDALKAEISRRVVPLVRAEEDIQRDMKMSGSNVESLRDVPLVIPQEIIQRDNKVRKIADLNAHTSRRVFPLEVDIHQGNNVNVKTSGHGPLVRDKEDIQRDHKVCERRKSRLSELEPETSRRAVPLVRAQVDIHRDNKVKAKALSGVRFVGDQEDIQRDLKVSEGRKRRSSELEPATLRSPGLLGIAEEGIQGDNKVMKTEGLIVYTLSGVRLVRNQENTNRDHKVSEGRKSNASNLEPDTLRRAVPLVRAEANIQRDNIIAKRRKRKIVETKAAGKSKVVPVEPKAVSESLRNKGDFLGRRKKNEEERVAVVDKDYMSYLTWLVDSIKDPKTAHVANLQNVQSDSDPPVPATLKESTIVPEKDNVLVEVKVEQELESWSDDPDIIAVSDSPFLDGEDTPFVPSRTVVDLDKESKEGESRCCLFTKELMDVLKKPYDEKELLELSKEASMQKPVTQFRELRKGIRKSYATDKLGQSYLQRYSDFDQEYKLVDGVDKVKALKLMRGLFFYLKNCSRAGAFKPWTKDI